MTLRRFESKLKEINRNLSIKRYNGIAGIFLSGKYVMRLEQGEILPFSEYEAHIVDGKEVERLKRRGRIAVARQLYGNKVISQKQIGFLGG